MGLLAKALGIQTLDADVPDGDYSANVMPPSRSRAPLTVDRAVTLPATFRAIQIIQSMGSNVIRNGLGAWRGDALVIPAPALIRQPDPWRTLRSFAARFLTNVATDGNNFLLKTKLDGVTSSVELLDPFLTHPRWDSERGKVYDSVKRLRDGRLQPITYLGDQVDHIWCGLELAGHDRALGPIQACRAAISGHIDSRDYASGWFSNPDVPSGILSTDQRLDPTSAQGYKDDWLNPKRGDGKPQLGPQVRVLGQGLSYAPIQLKPADAQWLESQAFGVVDIARMFGIPPDKLAAAVEGTSLSYTTTELVDRAFAKDTLLPTYLAPFEDALTELLVRGQDARVNLDEFLRPDPKTQADIDGIYLLNDVISAQEIRTRQRWQGPPPTPRPVPAPATPGVPA